MKQHIYFNISPWLVLFFFFLLSSTNLLAQYPSSRNLSSGGFNNTQNTSQSQSQKDLSRDTLSEKVYYYYADNAEEKFLVKDSSMINFHLYDPIRQDKYEYLHLGNLGSAHRQIVFQPRFHKGFDAGFHNYDLYLNWAEDIRYYQLEKAYSDIYFTNTNQEKTSFKARFSKPISKKMNLAIDYKNIRNEGQYTNQAARTNAFTANINYQSQNQKYRAYFNFTSNTIQQKENGGGNISNTTNFRKGIVAVGRPVNTESGESRYYQRDFHFSQYYLLQKPSKKNANSSTKRDSLAVLVTKEVGKIDSIQPIDKNRLKQRFSNVSSSKQKVSGSETGRKFTLKHQLILRKNTYKYTDVTSADYYAGFLLDTRGVRNYLETSQVENTVSIRTFRLAKDAKINYSGRSIESKNVSQKDLAELGVTHTFTDIYQEPLDSNVHNVFLFGKLQFTPSERLEIKTYGHLGMLKQIGDYYAKGDFLFDFKKIGKVELSLTNQLYSPSLLQQKLLVTQQAIWQNDFKKIFETSLSAKYYLSKLKLDITGNYHLINNFIYYDTNALPQQTSSGLNIVQLILKNKIDVGRFHLENTVYFQKTSQDVIRFPEIYSVHRLYMDLKLFKVMDTQLGADVRLNTPYFADNFQPLTAQFFLQNSQKVQFHPTIDVFFNFKIKDFRFFIIVENIYDYFTPNFSYYTYPYPQFDSQTRFGFRWLFLD